MRLSFVVPGSPLGQNAVYRRRRGWGMYMTEQGKAWVEKIRAFCRLHLPSEWPLDDGYDVDLTHYFATLRNDGDGPVKLELDALEGILYHNDRQVRDVTARKRLDRQNPRLEITVSLARQWRGIVMTLESLKSAIEADARLFAENVAKKSVIAFTEELSKTVVSGLSEPTPEVKAPAAPQERAKRGRPAKAVLNCKTAGCGRVVVAKGLCSSHYQKARSKARAKEAAKAQPEANGASATPAQ